jgi:hypothetical protein
MDVNAFFEQQNAQIGHNYVNHNSIEYTVKSLKSDVYDLNKHVEQLEYKVDNLEREVEYKQSEINDLQLISCFLIGTSILLFIGFLFILIREKRWMKQLQPLDPSNPK